MFLNENYFKLQESYLFSGINSRVARFIEAHPGRDIFRLGIGDVTRPLAPVVVRAMEAAAREMGDPETFRGYGPEQGYPFLRETIAGYYGDHGLLLDPEDIFISDGAKSDLGNILDLFAVNNTVMIPDPVYPVYVDTNVMAGRPMCFVNATLENDFLPLPDQRVCADIIYLCSPNNPTGAVYDQQKLKSWVEYALGQNAVILFDAAYEAFVRDKSLPRSIYEIPGARRCAIEFCSLSKTAGFTGTRCGYTVVPRELEVDGHPLRPLWLRRQTTKFNGVPYIVQRGAAAVFTDEGRAQERSNIEYYLENARLLFTEIQRAGIWFTGGRCSPYVWMRCPEKTTSWETFDLLLSEAGIVCTPGAGFGRNGEGFVRFSAFGARENIMEAAALLRGCLKFWG